MKRKAITIDELEAILNSEDETPLKINPDGSITRIKNKRGSKQKPEILTAGKSLGGEY